jgi:hypothetical protein
MFGERELSDMDRNRRGEEAGASESKHPTGDQNVLCNSSGAGSVPPRPIEIKLLKSP